MLRGANRSQGDAGLGFRASLRCKSAACKRLELQGRRNIIQSWPPSLPLHLMQRIAWSVLRIKALLAFLESATCLTQALTAPHGHLYAADVAGSMPDSGLEQHQHHPCQAIVLRQSHHEPNLSDLRKKLLSSTCIEAIKNYAGSYHMPCYLLFCLLVLKKNWHLSAAGESEHTQKAKDQEWCWDDLFP